jgi:hypothetical protein
LFVTVISCSSELICAYPYTPKHTTHPPLSEIDANLHAGGRRAHIGGLVSNGILSAGEERSP